MEKVNFDEYADDYDEILKDQLGFFDAKSDYFAEHKINIVSQHITRQPKSIFEYGCGTGKNLLLFSKAFVQSQISAFDISEKSIAIAKKRTPNVKFLSDQELDSENLEKFELIFIANVFHHIQPQLRSGVFQKMRHWLLKHGGEIHFFEHNPYNPVTRHMVKICPFDKDAVLLLPRESITLMEENGFEVVMKKYILFFPSFLGMFRPLEKYLGWLPLGGQYYIRARLKA